MYDAAEAKAKRRQCHLVSLLVELAGGVADHESPVVTLHGVVQSSRRTCSS